MKTLIKYEMIKLFQRRTTKIVIVSSFLFCVVALIAGLLIFEVVDEGMNVLKGIDAIRYDKATQKQFTGKYPKDRANKLLEEIEGINDNPEYQAPENERETPSPLKKEAYYKHLRKYESVWTVLNFQEYLPERIDKIRKGDLTVVYGVPIESVAEMVRKPDPKQEKLVAKKLVNMYEKIKLPYKIDYTEGWVKLIVQFSTVLAFLVGTIIVICLSPIFSDEYHIKTAPIILTTKYGKNKLNKAKIISAFSFSTIIFSLFLLLYTGFYGLTNGLSGIDSNIQVDAHFILSPYGLTMGELFLRVIGIGYLGVLSLTSITLFISAKCKNPYTSIIIMASIFYLPTIDVFIISQMAQKLTLLLPVNVMLALNIYRLPVIYNMFGFMVDQASMAAVVSIILTLVFVPFSYKTFRSYQDRG